MEGRKFSSSRAVVIYVSDFLARYDVDALRYYVAVAGPETQDTDFTWSEFVRRNNDELVATWGNLVNRSVSFAAKNIGSVPAAGPLTDLDRDLLARSQKAFGTVGEHLAASRFKFAINEAMRTVAEANKYFSEQAPWKLRESDPDRMRTVLHVALQLVDDANHKPMTMQLLAIDGVAVHLPQDTTSGVMVQMAGGRFKVVPCPDVTVVGSNVPVCVNEIVMMPSARVELWVTLSRRVRPDHATSRWTARRRWRR